MYCCLPLRIQIVSFLEQTLSKCHLHASESSKAKKKKETQVTDGAMHPSKFPHLLADYHWKCHFNISRVTQNATGNATPVAAPTSPLLKMPPDTTPKSAHPPLTLPHFSCMHTTFISEDDNDQSVDFDNNLEWMPMKKFDETYSVLTDKQCHVHTLTTLVGQDKRYLVSLFLNRCSLTSDLVSYLGKLSCLIFEECVWFEINWQIIVWCFQR